MFGKAFFCGALTQGGSALLFPHQGDKAMHAFGTAAFSSFACSLTGNSWLGFSSTLLLGVLKEMVDGTRLSPAGERDFHLNGDLGADILGAGAGAFLSSHFQF